MDVVSAFDLCVLESSLADISVNLDKIFDDGFIFVDETIFSCDEQQRAVNALSVLGMLFGSVGGHRRDYLETNKFIKTLNKPTSEYSYVAEIA